jgi:hypothetical protein
MAQGYYDEDGISWSAFVDNLPDGLTTNGFVIIKFNNSKNTILFESRGINPSETIQYDPDEYRTFLNYLKDEVDDDYPNIKGAVLAALETAGVVHDSTIQSDDYSRLRELNSQEEAEIWNNIEIEGSSKYNYVANIQFKIHAIAKPLEQRESAWEYIRDLDGVIKRTFLPSNLNAPFRKLLKDLIPKKSKNNIHQMEFKKFFEAFTQEQSILDNFFIVVVKTLSSNSEVSIEIVIKSNDWSNEFFEILDLIDETYSHFYNMMRLMVYETVLEYLNDAHPKNVATFKPNNYAQLKGTYGKYLNQLPPMI